MKVGSITIGTELATDKFDKQIAQLERQRAKLERKSARIDVKLNDADVKKAEQDLASYRDRLQKAKEELADLKGMRYYAKDNDFTVYASEFITKEMELKAEIEEINARIAEQEPLVAKNTDEAIKNLSVQEEIGVQIDEINNKIQGIELQKQNAEVDRMKEKFEEVGKSLKSSIGKVTKLALGIFGLRSAYMALRRASSELASYDKQYAANIEYIKYALTQAIAPVLRWIVGMAMKVLQVIGMITKALFGINIFQNASVDGFKKMKAGAGGTAKAVKEIKKQLAGFDEMNVLSDTSDTGSSGGGGGVATPDLDLTNIEVDFDLNAIAWKVDELLNTLDEKFNSGFTKIGENIKKVLLGLGFSETFVEMFDIAFKGVQDVISGFIKVVRGILDIILGFITGDLDLVKQGFVNLITGLGQIIQGIVEFIMGIVGMVIAFIMDILSTLWNWFYGHIIQPVWNFISSLLSKVKEALTNIWNAVKERFTKIKTFVSEVLNNIITLFKAVGTKVGNVIAGSFKAVVNAILGGVENILNRPIQAINGMIDLINSIPGVDIGWHLNEFHLPRLAKGGLINMPGRGVNIGGAIAGERGVEGVLPLTDSQMMEQLGEAIGKYITINANITNSMNGRIISRELRKIQSGQDFAYNN